MILPPMEGNFFSKLLRKETSSLHYELSPNPDAPEPYAHVTAYRILLTAANNVTVTGEPDWYSSTPSWVQLRGSA
ncbi:BnaC06g30640D [Brassica napus]|uniref:Uncharacterized protein n=3 Tax=Brassica TaxID=3705 RepID=A0A0D3CZ90_BRAOL|nr:unnamed protein product [Brassica napus]CDY40926.1 BnaC06g30640D [Brassica napus]VDD63934.1 unnamed protein product [Brassica oleracea]